MTPTETMALGLDFLYAALDRGAQRAAFLREREALEAEQADLALLTTEDSGTARWPTGLAERLQALAERRAEIDAALIRLDTQ